MLETAPSFSIYSQAKSDGIEGEEERENGLKIDAKVIEGSGDFSFVKETSMDLIKEEEDEAEISDGLLQKLGTNNEQVGPPSMYLATGLGFKDVGEVMMSEISEDYCRMLLDEHPNHPVVLKKYAELLQEKGDLHIAEEFYFRAAQADPGNGEILVQYAQLVWDLHHDQERAVTYFEHAAQTCPDNSVVMAAYAKFLWETEDDGEENSAHPNSVQENNPQKSGHSHTTDRIDADNVDPADVGSYYKRMIDENPSHPIYLKKYAQFLYQSERDLQGAEEYYSRAILVDPKDGEMLSQFATLLWELYHDQDRTLNYLERAIEAAPQNSDVLAAYARILWAIDD